MPRSFKNLFLMAVILFGLSALLCGNGFAEERTNSKYFNIVIHDGVNRAKLLQALRADYFLQMGPAFSAGGSNDADVDSLLGRALDAIYLSVSDVLDIHMYSFSVELDFFPDRAPLADELQKYLQRKIDVPSFYYYDTNRIYISCSDLTLGMLSHEIAHAIVSHYFVVPPSVKVQEILSGYVEYRMRKVVK